MSVVVLECATDDPALAMRRLEEFLARPGKRMPGREVEIVAATAGDEVAGVAAVPDLGVDQIAGFVRRHSHPPAWLDIHGGYTDIVHDLTVVIRRDRVVAIRTEDDIDRRLQNWLDDEPTVPFRRIPQDVLESALLQGEAKGLWLQSTNQRTSQRAETKNLGGQRLQDALNPIEDSNYAMGSAKADLDEDPNRQVLHGTVGTTPRTSSVWFKAAADLSTFATAVKELLILLEETRATASADTFPVFKRAVTDLSGVGGAYDLSIADPDLLTSPFDHSGKVKAARLLQDASLTVRGKDGSAGFFLDVGFGTVSGSLEVTVRADGSNCVLNVGLAGEPSDPPPVQEIRDALEYTELLKVYYRTGHVLGNGQMWTDRVPRARFSNWTFADFGDCRITQEKPMVENPQKAGGPSFQEIHAVIGKEGDRSIFGWERASYSAGWLICDDGPGEIADFLHISPGGVLSLIHVKGADSESPKRGVAASAYEVVTGQATKNLVFADLSLLRRRIENPAVSKPACWTDGNRVGDRTDFLEAMDLRDASDELRIVIVQPHVNEPTYQRLDADRLIAHPGDDLLRLFRLEALLVASRAAAIGMSADLEVIGSIA
ncbi:hypothetical protein [Kribbella sp. CA-294648]|uniref:hypothetical protein n=1 Tax=Kribbella sp. CA-294648 TaxID=3239948 RepID=UPI003D905080